MALADIRVIDLTDERGIYGTKLLADLGAQVIRPESTDGDPLRQRGPLCNPRLAPYRFGIVFCSNEPSSSGRRRPSGNANTANAGRSRGHNLPCDHSGLPVVDIEAAKRANPGLVVVEVSSFGTEGPWSDYLAPDIVAGALGGAAATTGDANTRR